MKELIVYVLEGCSTCKWLQKELDYHGLRYRVIDANRNPAIVEDIEDMLGTNMYPIVEVGAITGSREYIVYKERRKEEAYIKVTEYESVPHLLNLILSKI